MPNTDAELNAHRSIDGRHRGFYWIGNEVFDDFDLSIGALWLYSALARYADQNGQCFPSLTTLAKQARAGASKRGVTRQAILIWRKELIDAQLVRVDLRKSDQGARTSSLYTLLPTRPQSTRVNRPSQPGLTTPVNPGSLPLVNQGCIEQDTIDNKTQGTRTPQDESDEKASSDSSTPNGGAAQILPPTFEESWKSYPRKSKKKPALQVWNRLSDDDRWLAFSNIERKKREDPNWKPDRHGKTYVEHFSTYLNQERWTDEFEDSKRPTEDLDSIVAREVAAYEAIEARKVGAA